MLRPRAHRHQQHSGQIAIETAAPARPHLPRLRALALLRRRPTVRVVGSVSAGVRETCTRPDLGDLDNPDAGCLLATPVVESLAIAGSLAPAARSCCSPRLLLQPFKVIGSVTDVYSVVRKICRINQPKPELEARHVSQLGGRETVRRRRPRACARTFGSNLDRTREVQPWSKNSS